jgi:hypothetical protein
VPEGALVGVTGCCAHLVCELHTMTDHLGHWLTTGRIVRGYVSSKQRNANTYLCAHPSTHTHRTLMLRDTQKPWTCGMGNNRTHARINACMHAQCPALPWVLSNVATPLESPLLYARQCACACTHTHTTPVRLRLVVQAASIHPNI